MPVYICLRLCNEIQIWNLKLEGPCGQWPKAKACSWRVCDSCFESTQGHGWFYYLNELAVWFAFQNSFTPFLVNWWPWQGPFYFCDSVTFFNGLYFFVALLHRGALGFSALDGYFLGVLRASFLYSRVFLATGCFFSSFRFRPKARRRPGHCVVARAEIADFIAASLNEPLAPLPVGCSKRPEATAAFKYSSIAGDNVSAWTL